MRNRMVVAIVGALLTTALGANAVETVFRKAKVSDAREKQVDANFIVSDAQKSLIVSVAGHPMATVPFATIDKISYDYSKHRRIKQGAIVMVASLGAGAIVMLTKSKTHWLTINHHADGSPKELVLRLDKKEYKDVLRSLQAQTGKEIDFIADAGLEKKGKKEN